MRHSPIDDLQKIVAAPVESPTFQSLEDYLAFCERFLRYLQDEAPTRIVSPQVNHYIFYQYDERHRHHITRPLNRNLFFGSDSDLRAAFERFMAFLAALKYEQHAAAVRPDMRAYLASGEINSVIYTLQQSIGSVSDSFENANQARKRVGILFERLVKFVIQEVGLVCEPRTIRIDVPNAPGVKMSYELDVVFSRARAVLQSADPAAAAETQDLILPHEVVGSVKTTSKDRIDKVFLDKYLLGKLLQRDIPVVAVFLHDVQRAARKNHLFGISSTFLKGHFLGYTAAFTKLDGVYYVDPRPEMEDQPALREQIRDFQRFLTHDLWTLSSRE